MCRTEKTPRSSVPSYYNPDSNGQEISLNGLDCPAESLILTILNAIRHQISILGNALVLREISGSPRTNG